ncbi:hypothetical protein SAMN05192553_11281 [Cyclobacterium xiamenense]|uniref:Uncharacterized protein n=1 Tax=Cyclobacterium xiamenense TaxID=1297121 RepID=A0A1H7BWS3_9BACT|nr:hypothetical protein SAMN05192553_11281 [Cyclobacterium xiamenense]
MDAKTDNKYAKKDSLYGFTAQQVSCLGYFGTMEVFAFLLDSPGFLGK